MIIIHFDRQFTCEFPPDRTDPPNRVLAKIVCTIFSWDLSMRPSCFISNGHSGSPHSIQSSIVSHCFALSTLRDILMVWLASSFGSSVTSVPSFVSFFDKTVSSQSKYFKKHLNFVFWLFLWETKNKQKTNYYRARDKLTSFKWTYICKLLKKCVKLKSCNVGCVFSVRFGNVEKNAFANNAATRL